MLLIHTNIAQNSIETFIAQKEPRYIAFFNLVRNRWLPNFAYDVTNNIDQTACSVLPLCRIEWVTGEPFETTAIATPVYRMTTVA